MDAELRQLQRSGNTVGYLRYCVRSMIFTSGEKQLRPRPLYLEPCANKCGNTLEWSNCSYCRECHDSQADDRCREADRIEHKPVGVVIYTYPNKVSSIMARTCNYERKE